MGLRVREPFTEKVLVKLTELEPMFSLTSGAAMELFGFNDLRSAKRWSRYRKEKAARERKRVMKVFENLVRADLIASVKGKRGRYRLTPKGWAKYALHYARHMRKEKTKRAKGRGYIIIFDIPEKHRGFRDTLRQVFYSLKYIQLQKSVFLTYDLESFEFMGRIIANCELEDRVKCVIAEKVF